MQANTYDSPGTTGGNRESLSDELTIFEPEETPFTSMVTKAVDAKATFHEVVADRLRSPRRGGSREGDSGPKGGNKAVKRKRFGAYLHRWFDSFGVTDVQQAVSKAGGVAGVDNEYGDAKVKCVREVKRDMEASGLASEETQGGDDDTMVERGYFNWVQTTAQTTAPVPADYRPTGNAVQSSVTALLESHFILALTALSARVGNGKEWHAFVGDTYADDIDLFAVQISADGSAADYTNAVAVQGGETKTISLIVSVFQTSKGRVVVHNDKFIDVTAAGVHNGDACALAMMDTWKLSLLEDLHAQDDEDDAGGMSGFVKAIGGRFCSMPAANGAIYGTLNS